MPESSLDQLPAPPRRRPPLSRGRVRILRAVAEALFAREGRAVPVDRLDWLEVEVNQYLASTTGVTRSFVWFSLTLLEIAPPFSGIRLARFSRCTVAERQRCLHELETSPLFFSAVVAVLSKALLCTIYFEHPDALAETLAEIADVRSEVA